MKITGVLAALLATAVGCGSEPYDADNQYEAEAQCEGFVADRLKAPSTAEYDLTAEQSGGSWVVAGTVDAENGFGAQLRSDVRCVLHFEGDTAYLDDIAIN